MSDVTIKYGSTGFEKVTRELSELEKKGSESGSWFTPINKALKDSSGGAESFFSKLSEGFEKIKTPLASFAADLIKISGAIGAMAVAVGGAATYAFEKWAMGVLKTTESFRMLEISMYGATKSWEAVATASKFAKEYAAEYPAMYGDIMRALQGFAYIPALRPMIQRGDVQNMKEMMHIIQGMMTIRPEQGVTGAIYALREALAGNWRSLMYRFDIPIASIAEAAGMTMEQMRQSPEQAIKALKAWIDSFVGAETMAMMAKNLSVQVGNLRDKYEMWLDSLGKTGVYEKVVNYLLKLNEWLDNLMKSERVKEWTEKLNTFLEGIVDRIAGVFTEGIDWNKVISFDDLMAALSKVKDNAIRAFIDIWESVKGPIAKVLQSVFKFLGETILPVIREVFYPIGKEIAKQVVIGVYDFMKEHPIISALYFGYKGAEMGKVFGKWGMGIGAAAGVIAGITPWALEKIGGGKQETLARTVEKQAEKTERLTAEQEKEINSLRGLNESLERFKQIFTQTVDVMQWARTHGGALPVATEKKLTVEQLEELRKLREQQEWTYYTQWSRMGMMMAQAPETVGPRLTPFQRYARGELTWEQMLAAERVERFQEEQLSKLSEMAEVAEREKSYSYLGRVYGEMFNVAYQRGDFGRAQEYMNASLDALVKAMEQERADRQQELGLLGSIDRNTADMVIAIKSLTPTGMKTTYMPVTREEEWSEDELQYYVRRAKGEV